jgi:prepilin peptidase CpaA
MTITLQAILLIIVFSGLFWAVVTDLRERIIPDEIVILTALSGLILRLAAHPAQVWVSLAAAAAVFLGFAFLCRYGMLGGGDVKLVAAVTLLVPPQEVGRLLMEIALAGGLLSCVYLCASFLLRSAPQSSASLEAHGGATLSGWFRLESARIASRKQVPYAIAIVGGFGWHSAGESLKCFSAMSCLF